MANQPAQSNRTPSNLPRFGPGPRGPMMGGPVVKAKDMRGTLRRVGSYILRQKWGLIAVFSLVLVSTSFNLAGPYLMGRAIDLAVLKGNLPLLLRYAVAMIAVYLVAALTNGAQTYLMARVAQNTVRDIRNDLFVHLQGLSLRFFDQNPHGELMSRLTNDVDNINNVLNEGLTQFISSVLTLIGVIVVMILLNPRLALVSIITVPLLTWVARQVSKRTLKGFRDQQEALGTLNGMIEETVTGARVVKAYVREKAVVETFDVQNQKLRWSSTRAQTFSNVLGPVMNLINNVSFAIVAGAGGWMALQNLATVGAIAAFLNYSRQLSFPLNQMANLYNMIQSALAGAERVFDVIDEHPEINDKAGAVVLEQIQGDVQFDQVDFGYDEGQKVLEKVSLHAHPGQTIALVGPTGAGKTTIINLLSRFYDIQGGAIRVDGHDIRDVQKASLRRQLGIVLQDSFLFTSSVMENIRYGRLEASDEEVIAAAKMANADAFIRHLPQGYQTQLTERGSNLSQGQRQLVSIARAILADPGILILDEATSSVDTRTEMHIQEAMLRLMQGRTSFVIAHRLSTIREADEILVIDHGQILEQGSHEQLMEKRGFYHHLYISQFRGQVQEALA